MKKLSALSLILSLAALSGCSQSGEAEVKTVSSTAPQIFEFATTTQTEDDFDPLAQTDAPDTSPIYRDTPEETAVGALKAILENDSNTFKRYAHKSDSRLGEVREEFLKKLRTAEAEDYRRDYTFEDFSPYIWNEGRFYTLDGDSRQYNFYTENFQVLIRIRVEYDVTEDKYYMRSADVYGEKKTDYSQPDGDYVKLRFNADNTSLENDEQEGTQ
ncbi:MAG: hypothetical protein NC452_05735 [Eubacterium sp.]|nr:hypothetical protein [Eubacterium sp.]